ncbi:hypothetical protein [Paenibacillus sanfengchensis]|uniref:hypothetical protein n=1 Tax=Paenibacillus sanfengchensis TaxID=3119819 RepID=UPI003A5C5302
MHTLKYWLRKLKGTSSNVSTKSRPPAFIPLSVGDTASVAAQPMLHRSSSLSGK